MTATYGGRPGQPRSFPYHPNPHPDPAPREVLIELLDDGPDDYGRSHFVISWRERIQGGGQRNGAVRGQVQHASIEAAMDRWHARHPDWSFRIVQAVS